LPRPTLDEEGNEIDPREELVKHLLEYKKYKSVLGQLSQMEDAEMGKEKRGNILKEIKKLAETSNVDAELQDLDLYKLLKVFEKVLERHEAAKNRPQHHVVQYPFTIAGQKDFILRELGDQSKLSFESIIAKEPTKIGVIFNFLAILELLQLQKITLKIGIGFNNFWVEKRPEAEEGVKSV